MQTIIKIPKKVVTRIENPFFQGCEVLFPASSKYAGYKTKLSDYFIFEDAEYFRIYNKFENKVFTLEKAEREPGKRYKRYNIGWEELCSELAEYNEQFNRDKLTSALVMFNEYEYSKKGFEKSRNQEITLGKHNDTWCYVYNAQGTEERHRISAKHFKILKDNLISEEVEKYENLFIELDERKNRSFEVLKIIEETEKYIRLLKWQNALPNIVNKASSILDEVKLELIQNEELIKNIYKKFGVEEKTERIMVIKSMYKNLSIEESDAERR